MTIINDGVETVIHSPYVNELKLESGKIKKEINKIDSFEMSFYLNNPAYGKIKPLKTLVNVLNLKTNKYEFEGRVLGPSKNMDSSGLFDESYECEGELGYLHDSQQKHREFRGSPKELLVELLNYHNSQVETYKQFQIGNVTVIDPNDYIYLYTSAEKDTFDTIKEKLIDRLGGELQIRKENGVRFLDYLERVGEDKSTEIKLAKNLLNMSVDVDPTDIITRLTPLGTRIESEDEQATDASEARLTIESVNNGVPYIDNEALKKEFGIQGGAVTWDDVTDPNNLLSKGQDWFANQKTSLNQYKIAALDLFLIGLDIDYLDVGNSHPVKNPIMGIDERLRIIGKSININEPQNSSLTIGDKFKTLSEYQNEANKSAQKVVDLQNTVSRQSQTIAALKTELTAVDNAVKEVQRTLSENDIPAIEQAVTELQTAIQNLNNAIGQIPTYGLATPTKDGLMPKSDKAKLNLITATKSVNLDTLKTKLDDLVRRVEVLEGGSN
ncbi:phage tail protein [Caldibacillus thermoamylovorans]|uniref:phage tail spike protein n=1 Tax=Caldibacillus thermoamylovorans TaxID=35841 RepID=UPI001D068DCE|nr:phage tail spike protein [Caldibacillus thermoamylovorans]MCB5934500.1 phage tail protein [Bacillus sp. DFI.2.34]MCB7076475.1 phage tail protein [Caldibacillus thermoamylovorans]